MALSYAFNAETETPQSVARRRQIADMLAGRIGRATNVGQGIGDVISGIAGGFMNYRSNKAEKAGNESADKLFQSLALTGAPQAPQSSGGGGSSFSLPAAPEYKTALPAGLPASPDVAAVQGDAMAKRPSMPNVPQTDMVSGINATARALGIKPEDLATAISYETAGTFDPAKAGPRTQWGQHKGLIQFGEPQAKKYGVDWNNPIGSQLGEDGAIAKYLRDTGVKPGMGMMDIYSAINAGGVGRYNASDANNGGAPGSVADKVNGQMQGHREKALAMLGMGGGGQPQAPVQVASNDAQGAFQAAQPMPVQQGGQGMQPMPANASGPDVNELLRAMANPWLKPEQRAVLQTVYEQQMQQQDPVRQLELEKARLDIDAAKNPRMTPYQQAQIDMEKAKAASGANSDEWGLNPIWLQNDKGEWMLTQPSKSGAPPRPMQFPEGFKPAPQTRLIDQGDGYLTQPTRGDGSPIGGVIPKNLEAEAVAKKLGADQGDNLALLNSMKAKMPGLEKVVAELDALADKATYTEAGKMGNELRKQFGFGPSEGAVARTKYASVVANQVLPLLRDTFGAQFTAAEGERLLATLGDPDVTPDEKKAVLHAFIDQKKRDIEGLSVQTGEQPAPTPPNQGELSDDDLLKKYGG